MSKILKKDRAASIDKKTHMGYNEKNPSQPQGAFKADSMETEPVVPEKQNKSLRTKKRNEIK